MSKSTLPIGVKDSPSNTKPMGVAVIGCGYWGTNYVRIFNELTESRVVAVCEQSSDRLKEVARRFPNVYLTTQVEDVLSQPDVQGVVVCTEATSHFNVTRRLLLAGKHVLVEKPLAMTWASFRLATPEIFSATCMSVGPIPTRRAKWWWSRATAGSFSTTSMGRSRCACLRRV